MSKNEHFINFKMEQEAWGIGEALLQGILLEVSSYPKPGLVSALSRGAHRDMNILTFMVSSAAIAAVFYKCAQAGIDHTGEIPDLLPVIRGIGIEYEKRLLESTKGVNTQRGILFAGGILCGAAGYRLKKSKSIGSRELFQIVAQMTEGLVARELENINTGKERLTAGEKLYLKYNVKGIRGEVEAGFPAVKDTGLPALKAAFNQGKCLNQCIVHTLISLMTCVEDTTILWRKDLNVLTEVQNIAREILAAGSVFTRKGLEQINKADRYFITENISPGGSADLVSITIAAYLLENKQFPCTLL
ncbi:MAG: triphosphoribosyl-dephospho-CoA synthase [Peptococcaceae bacterium]